MSCAGLVIRPPLWVGAPGMSRGPLVVKARLAVSGHIVSFAACRLQ